MLFRLDHDNFVRGVRIYVQEDKPCKKLTKHNLPDDIKGNFIEIDFRKYKLV